MAGEPPGMIAIYAYGWYNGDEKVNPIPCYLSVTFLILPLWQPWETPGQMPFMYFADVQKEYLFSIVSEQKQCTYSITDLSTGEE